ncbi:MAG: phosphate regulon transcriptional regulator PhoB [Proteobacteria bacterium]|nr:phosphate regulon transcriptional regulator PhoB [Pseudomonadota bacterium]
MKPFILIVEDEPPQAELLSYNLEREGYRTRVASDGDEALALTSEDPPDLIVLDWMMPEISGIEVCRQLRRRADAKNLPIIMLTARGEESDRVRGLDSGADDYMVKPYSPGEMVARIRALLRRTRPGFSDETLEYGGIVMDLAAHKVTYNGKAVRLGPTEYRLLLTLIERPRRVFSREQLLDLAWGREIYVEQRTVDVHIRRLRKALSDAGSEDLIRTVRGAGYSLDTDNC